MTLKIILNQSILTFLLLINYTSGTQTVVDFEEFNMASESYLNDGGVDHGFFTGNVFLPNDYTPEWDAWTGWSISSTTDTQDPSYSNQYSAIAGSGVAGSATYAVTYAYDGSTIHLTGEAKGGDIEGLYITNSTVAYMSMLNGDAIAKRFGGESGNDPDYLKLVIRKYLEGNMGTDSVEFFLADFRNTDNTQDYIINDWQLLDLESLGRSDSLYFSLRSSDIGIFGMNTPAYFCIDDLTTRDNGVSNSTEVYNDKISVYHDIVNSELRIQTEGEGIFQYMIADIKGHIITDGEIQSKMHQICTNEFSTGYYFFILTNLDRGIQKSCKFIKR